jgi:hypothetical protein
MVWLRGSPYCIHSSIIRRRFEETCLQNRPHRQATALSARPLSTTKSTYETLITELQEFLRVDAVNEKMETTRLGWAIQSILYTIPPAKSQPYNTTTPAKRADLCIIRPDHVLDETFFLLIIHHRLCIPLILGPVP